MPILNTIRAGITKKAIIDTDVTLMTAGPATTMLNATIVAKDYYSPSNKQNGIEVAWTMQAATEECYCEILAARANGDVVLVWTGTLSAGAQVATDATLAATGTLTSDSAELHLAETMMGLNSVVYSTYNWSGTMDEVQIDARASVQRRHRRGRPLGQKSQHGIELVTAHVHHQAYPIGCFDGAQ